MRSLMFFGGLATTAMAQSSTGCYNPRTYRGGDLSDAREAQAKTAEECQALCQSVSACEHFSFLVGGHYDGCILKTKHATTTGGSTECTARNSGGATSCTSGPKVCQKDWIETPYKGCNDRQGREKFWLTENKPYTPEECRIGCESYKYFTIDNRDGNCKCADVCVDSKHGNQKSYEILSTPAPTKAPSHAPTKAPSHAPTKAPSHAPTKAPSHAPTKAPSAAPTHAPTPQSPPAPEWWSGCYVLAPLGCPNKPTSGLRANTWHVDSWGEKHRGAGKDKNVCLKNRKHDWNAWCGVSNIKMHFVAANWWSGRRRASLLKRLSPNRVVDSAEGAFPDSFKFEAELGTDETQE